MFFADMSNREKSIWASVLLDIVIALYFFPQVFAMEGGISANASEMAGIIIAVILMAIIGSAIIKWLLGVGKAEQQDERDLAIDAKAHKLGYWALCSAVVFLSGHVVVNEATQEFFGFQYEILSAGQIATYMVFSLVISAFVKDGAQLFFYRRGY